MESSVHPDVTRVLNAMSSGNDAERLFQEVYDELRRMAAARMAAEGPGHTLQATALVHEAYLRLAGATEPWANRKHFFGAAAEAMRRILVESARRRAAAKRGGDPVVLPLDENLPALESPDDGRLLLVHDALDSLAAKNPLQAAIVKMRVFAGLGHDEIAALLEVNEKTVRRHWELAKLALFRIIQDA